MKSSHYKVSLQRVARLGSVLFAVALLAACSNGGVPTQENQVIQSAPVADYTGPAPANADIQAFKLSLWDNIKANNRCGSCHNAGGQPPMFARNDDVNLAYQAANTVANLAQPDQSRLVTKVASGHNCWLTSPAACGDIMTTWIRNWAGATAGGGNVIALQAPAIKEVGASRTFPADSALFASTIYPLLRTVTATAAGAPNCARCHAPSAATPQAPFFASNDVDAAYAAVKAQINLDTPSASRLVVRLRDEFHNCWTDCGAAATDMLNRVTSFQQGIPLTQVDPSLVISKALTLYDGTVAAGGNRYDSNVIALYEFKTGMGNTIFDTSGVEPSLNLTMSGDITWVGGWGVNVKPTGKAQGTATNSKKLADLIKSTGEFSMEVWAVNGNVMQEDAYIVSYSAGAMARNATLSQREYQYEAFTRSDKTGANGNPTLLTRAADEDAQASLQHIVLTYSPVSGRRLYVNGADTGDVDAQGGGSLRDWDDTFALVLGNDKSKDAILPAALRKPFQIAAGAFRPGKDDSSKGVQGLGLLQVDKSTALKRGERFEIGEIGNVRQPDHGDGRAGRTGREKGAGVFDDHRVLGLDPEIPEPGKHPEDRLAGTALDPLDALMKQGNIAAEAVDDKALDPLLLGFIKAGQGADDLGEDTAPVNVGHQDHRGIGVGGCAEVDDITRHEIDLGAGTSALHDHEVMGLPQPVQGRAALAEQKLLLPVVGLRRGLQPGAAVEHHLGPHIAGRLEQHGIHVHMRDDPGRFGLNDLRPPHLGALGRDPGIVRHVLSLERRNPDAAIGKDPAQGSRDDTLADIRSGPEDSQARCTFCHCSLRKGWNRVSFHPKLLFIPYPSIPLRARTPRS